MLYHFASSVRKQQLNWRAAQWYGSCRMPRREVEHPAGKPSAAEETDVNQHAEQS